MGKTIEWQRHFSTSVVEDEWATRLLVGVSGIALAIQVTATNYGAGHAGAAGIWFAFGCVLLWLVYGRRSRVARGFIVVTSLVGTIVYSFSAVNDAGSAFLAVAFLAQALPLMAKPVRLHVQTAT